MKTIVLLILDQFVNDVEWEVMTIIPTIVQTQHNVLTAEKTICQDPVTVKFGKKKKEIMKLKVTKNLTSLKPENSAISSNLNSPLPR